MQQKVFTQNAALLVDGEVDSVPTLWSIDVFDVCVGKRNGFEIQTFAAPVFAKLRSSLDITEEEYINSVCIDGCYLQFVSNSKSKADFFVTNDKRFFLKTQSRREVRFLLSNLQAYMGHLEKYPHSLMVRFLGQGKSWFADQVKVDAAFLQELNVLDYSLLLAQQPLHQDELEGKHSLANIVVRAQKSLDLDVSPTESYPPTLPLLSETQGEIVPDTPDCGSGQPHAAAEHTSEGIPLQEINCFTKETRNDSVMQDFHQHHHRLLLNCKNAIHVVDGPDRRYFVGIIDIFTVYNWKKRLENLWKSLRYPGRAFSTVRPAVYSRRFCQWLQDHSQ
ncbi:hypothetical protein F2P81_013622 [Scophthalmus maximus]|uniref:PIPK domain-containing protein n=1 Tax=Scophthalmus maximus TaxID=52904 RepID=A0A6A4SEI9_SCOMX|nr:hypothetical protein F2P81_013622 [Scophthalmus maximus]